MKTVITLLLLFAAMRPLNASDDSSASSSIAKEDPFVNSLGMKFVPVEITGGPADGKRILFSIWDTRLQDYIEYTKEVGLRIAKPRIEQPPVDARARDDVEFARANKIAAILPFFEQKDTEPVVNVSWTDAVAFCAWLTAKERSSGRIALQDVYRLPTDHEWSCAVGIGRQENANATPESKSEKIPGVYFWGNSSSPSRGSGNYYPLLEVDGFEHTSPVGSFPANAWGLYDMGGNVWQWCEDWMNAAQKEKVLRGGSWSVSNIGCLQSSYRGGVEPWDRANDFGFRCVLEVSAK